MTGFNFGVGIKRWIKTVYANASTCVSVNGHYSSWVNIQRGVRQGDPCSPYIYLTCADIILSLVIRQSSKIKGIKLTERGAKLSQSADDTTLCLDGSEESFKEAIKILKTFLPIFGVH